MWPRSTPKVRPPRTSRTLPRKPCRAFGFDLLVVCGFAFDPHVSEEAKRYGKLTVLVARMNPDLSLGDELLKKTGAGNLSMVFGEPDIMSPRRRTVTWLSPSTAYVYDPTTGETRNASIDDIACWFIDTEYNGESFFVRHAYFTGADEPYDKLKRALRLRSTKLPGPLSIPPRAVHLIGRRLARLPSM